jgi:hypothetical protein
MNNELKTITHGLIAIDPENEKDGMVNIEHFVGYWAEPTPECAEHLREELKTDKTFGLTEIADRLVILPAPEDIIEYYKNIEDEED